jgi:hypothetical protein
MDEHNITVGGATSALFRALGKANDFFFGDGTAGPEFSAFEQWVEQEVIAPAGSVRQQIRSWVPANLRTAPRTVNEWVGDVAAELLAELRRLRDELRPITLEDDAEDEDDERNVLGDEELLEFLFSRGMLPSYAFPTDLASFTVERLAPAPGGRCFDTPGSARSQPKKR